MKTRVATRSSQLYSLNESFLNVLQPLFYYVLAGDIPSLQHWWGKVPLWPTCNILPNSGKYINTGCAHSILCWIRITFYDVFLHLVTLHLLSFDSFMAVTDNFVQLCETFCAVYRWLWALPRPSTEAMCRISIVAGELSLPLWMTGHRRREGWRWAGGTGETGPLLVKQDRLEIKDMWRAICNAYFKCTFKVCILILVIVVKETIVKAFLRLLPEIRILLSGFPDL